MVKNKTVLLYTYFYIFFHVLRPTYINIYIIYPFYALEISVKMGVKLNQKLATLPPSWARAPTELPFSKILFHWYLANQDTNKTVLAISFFSNILWIISTFNCFHAKYTFKARRVIAIKKEWLLIRLNAGTVLCSSLLEICVQSLKLIV